MSAFLCFPIASVDPGALSDLHSYPPVIHHLWFRQLLGLYSTTCTTTKNSLVNFSRYSFSSFTPFHHPLDMLIRLLNERVARAGTYAGRGDAVARGGGLWKVRRGRMVVEGAAPDSRGALPRREPTATPPN